MPTLTPSFLWDLESNMRIITLREYDRLTSNLWYTNLLKIGPKSESKRERVIWMLDTARIKDTDHGGHIPFEDLVSQTTEVEMKSAAAGLKLYKNDVEDMDGHGIDAAVEWSRQIGSYAAYWPQKKFAEALKTNGKTYDGKPFFATDHPVNPFRTQAGTYSNVFTGAASGAFPGALRIDEGVSIEQAIANLGKAIAYIAQMKMPNGEDPRFLTPVSKLIVPPALAVRATQITNAKYIAAVANVAGTLAGASDVEAVVRNLGLGQPIIAPELGAAFGGSDQAFYLGMDEATSSDLGAFMWIPREDFSVRYYGNTTEAQLDRMNQLEWHTQGRYGLMSGHPFCLFKALPA